MKPLINLLAYISVIAVLPIVVPIGLIIILAEHYVGDPNG